MTKKPGASTSGFIFLMEKRRLEKFKLVVARRQPGLTVILENVTDTHNIGAVLRSADSVGLLEIYVLNTDAHLQTDFIKIGKRTSMGTAKWVEVHYFTNLDACFERVRCKYGRILGALLGEGSTDFHHLDLTQPAALLFGNEHRGLSKGALANMDGSFLIPQVGMAESLNISVACGVTLYEAFRQRREAGFYGPPHRLNEAEQAALFQSYLEKHEQRERGSVVVYRNGELKIENGASK